MSIELVMLSNHFILCLPFPFCLQSSPASGSFPESQLFTSGGQSIKASASASVLPMNIQGWPTWGLSGLISLQSKGLLKSHLQHHNLKASILQCSAFFMIWFSHPYTTTRKTIALTIWTLVSKVISLLFNMLFRFVIAFLPRSMHLLISWLQSPSTVSLEPRKRKSASTFSPSICYEVMGLDAMNLSFLNAEFQANFFTLLFYPHQEVI